MSLQLTVPEKDSLAENEQIIERGIKTFWSVGEALAKIRAERLYRETHASFSGYCHDRWHLSKPYATQIMQAASARENLVAIATTLPTTEAQVRPLAGLKPEQQREAWTLAENDNGGQRPTARDVKEAVRKITASKVATVADQPRPKYIPHDGMQFAEMAICNLEKIHWNDAERVAALQKVINWATKRLEPTPQQIGKGGSIR